jgi:periplasmic mercuric ion binding protein
MMLKATLACFVFPLALGAAVSAADVSVQLNDVHLCCGSCVRGVDKAVATIDGATAVADKEAGTVVLTAADKPTLQKAVNALVAAGYFGVSNDPAIKVDAGPAVEAAAVKSLNVSGVHLCCKTCVTAVNRALKKVPGVEGTTAVKGAPSFEVTGEFSPKAVIEALHEEGLSGKAGE